MVLLSCICVPLIAWIDWYTGRELNFFVFYFLPVSAIAWHFGQIPALGVSLICALAWFVSTELAIPSTVGHFHAVWNTGIRLVGFMYIGFAIARMRELLTREQEAATALRAALSEIKVLEGVLPICAQCKKIRNEQQNWVQLERYISQRTDALFTHGYCPDCARKILEDAGLSESDLEGPG